MSCSARAAGAGRKARIRFEDDDGHQTASHRGTASNTSTSIQLAPNARASYVPIQHLDVQLASHENRHAINAHTFFPCQLEVLFLAAPIVRLMLRTI